MSANPKAASLTVLEQKFLLKLFHCEDQKAHISALSPNPKTPVAKRDRTCQSLSEKGLVEFDSEIHRFTLAPPGRVLLTMHTTSLPVTPDELKLLRTCKGSMTPEKLGSSVPHSTRQQMIRTLADRKLLKIIKTAITTVSLTADGKQFVHSCSITAK
ncbi:MAG: hypothetical protein AAFQ63_02910 [Cyanobacteria bacterium J06621_11]